MCRRYEIVVEVNERHTIAVTELATPSARILPAGGSWRNIAITLIDRS